MLTTLSPGKTWRQPHPHTHLPLPVHRQAALSPRRLGCTAHALSHKGSPERGGHHVRPEPEGTWPPALQPRGSYVPLPSSEPWPSTKPHGRAGHAGPVGPFLHFALRSYHVVPQRFQHRAWPAPSAALRGFREGSTVQGSPPLKPPLLFIVSKSNLAN